MLKRFPFAATLYQIAQWRELRFSQHTLKFQVQLDPFPPQHVREQMLRIQPRIFDAVLLEICCRRLQHFENGHVASYQADSVRYATTADSLNRSATSAACSAPINSSKSPSIKRSRL